MRNPVVKAKLTFRCGSPSKDRLITTGSNNVFSSSKHNTDVIITLFDLLGTHHLHFQLTKPRWALLGLPGTRQTILWSVMDRQTLPTIQRKPQDWTSPTAAQPRGPSLFIQPLWSAWNQDKDMVISHVCGLFVDFVSDPLTHLPLVPHICVSDSGQYWSR